MTNTTVTRKRCEADFAQLNEDASGYNLFAIGGRKIGPFASQLLQTKIRWGMTPVKVTADGKGDDEVFVADRTAAAAAMWCMYDSVPDFIFDRFELERHGVDPRACDQVGYELLKRVNEHTYTFVTALPEPLDGTVAVVRVTAFDVPRDLSHYSLRLELLDKVRAPDSGRDCDAPPPPLATERKCGSMISRLRASIQKSENALERIKRMRRARRLLVN